MSPCTAFKFCLFWFHFCTYSYRHTNVANIYIRVNVKSKTQTKNESKVTLHNGAVFLLIHHVYYIIEQ